MLDFEVQRCTRRCAATDRALEAGEAFYSILLKEGAEVVRRDFCEDAWEGPPAAALGWWKSQMPGSDERKPRLAPNEILLHLFLQWQEDAQKAESRYVLTLLMVRRRVLRLVQDREGTDNANEGEAERARYLAVYCPRTGETYRVLLAEPTGSRIAEIETELGELLFAKGE